MCSSLLPAQPHREHCSGWLVVNMFCIFTSSPSPIPSPPASTATTTQRQNRIDGQEEQCRGGEPGLPSQNWGEKKRSLDLPSVSTTQDKCCQMHSLPCAYCTEKQTPKWGLRNVSLALWPLVASACPHTPAQPCCDCWSFYPWMHSSQLRVCTLGMCVVSGCGTVLMQLENCS